MAFNRFYFRNRKSIKIPKAFEDLILKKSEKWDRQYKTPLIPFTIAYESNYEIWAIAIVHPFDMHKSTIKISENIVRGRIKREAGLLLNRETYSQRTKKSLKLSFEEGDPKLIIPFPDYIISPSFKRKK